MSNALIRLPVVQARTGLARSTIYLRISQGTFPRPVLLGGKRAVGWSESSINDWITRQIEQSRSTAQSAT
jgi:prophage regulatory protein